MLLKTKSVSQNNKLRFIQGRKANVKNNVLHFKIKPNSFKQDIAHSYPSLAASKQIMSNSKNK